MLLVVNAALCLDALSQVVVSELLAIAGPDRWIQDHLLSLCYLFLGVLIRWILCLVLPAVAYGDRSWFDRLTFFSTRIANLLDCESDDFIVVMFASFRMTSGYHVVVVGQFNILKWKVRIKFQIPLVVPQVHIFVLLFIFFFNLLMNKLFTCSKVLSH